MSLVWLFMRIFEPFGLFNLFCVEVLIAFCSFFIWLVVFYTLFYTLFWCQPIAIHCQYDAS